MWQTGQTRRFLDMWAITEGELLVGFEAHIGTLFCHYFSVNNSRSSRLHAWSTATWTKTVARCAVMRGIYYLYFRNLRFATSRLLYAYMYTKTFSAWSVGDGPGMGERTIPQQLPAMRPYSRTGVPVELVCGV